MSVKFILSLTVILYLNHYLPHVLGPAGSILPNHLQLVVIQSVFGQSSLFRTLCDEATSSYWCGAQHLYPEAKLYKNRVQAYVVVWFEVADRVVHGEAVMPQAVQGVCCHGPCL